MGGERNGNHAFHKPKYKDRHMKNQIIAFIQNITGVTALKAQVETLQRSNESLLTEVVSLRDNRMDDSQIRDAISDAVEGMVDSNELSKKVEDEIEGIDWDNAVSEALSERRTSRGITEIVEETIDSQFTDGTNDKAIIEIIQSELDNGNLELAESIRHALTELEKSKQYSEIVK